MQSQGRQDGDENWKTLQLCDTARDLIHIWGYILTGLGGYATQIPYKYSKLFSFGSPRVFFGVENWTHPADNALIEFSFAKNEGNTVIA